MINDIFVVITIYFTTCHLWQCIILFYYLPFAVVHHIICSKKIKFSAAITYGQSKHPKHYEKEKNASLITMTTAVSYAKVVQKKLPFICSFNVHSVPDAGNQ
jgi:hypothetical protein